jgi:phage terminase small subunit
LQRKWKCYIKSGGVDVMKKKKKEHKEAFERILKRSIEKNKDLLTELQKR